MRRIRLPLICLAAILMFGNLCYAGKTTPTPEPTATPTPAVYGPVYYNGEQNHEKVHKDAFGNEILLSGTASATGVLQFIPGSGRDSEVTKAEMEQVLGWPDYDPETGTGALLLGAGGSVVLDFNAFIRDSAGVFLHVFTTGANSDQIAVALSADAVKWYEVELKNKEFTGADKYTNLPASMKPRYVKITATKQAGAGDIAIDSVVVFAPESLTPKDPSEDDKAPIYEKLGVSRRALYVICGVLLGLFAVWAILFTLRRYNIRRKKHRLQLVYPKQETAKGSAAGRKKAGSGAAQKSGDAGKTDAPGKAGAHSIPGRTDRAGTDDRTGRTGKAGKPGTDGKDG